MKSPRKKFPEGKVINLENSHLVYHPWEITRKMREEQNGHRAAVLWMSGLPASGKTTVAKQAGAVLVNRGIQTTLLDGDKLRTGLCNDLGFSQSHREENLRRAAEVAQLLFDIGQIVICSFISPFQKDRDFARSLIEAGNFYEVYISCGIDACKTRDPKGHYKKALTGEIKQFTGISSPYEAPRHAELVIETEKESAHASTQKLVDFLYHKQIIPLTHEEAVNPKQLTV